MNRRIYLPCLQLTSKKYFWWIVTRTPLFFSSKVEEWLMMILVMGNCLLDLFAVFDLDLEPIWVDNSCCFCLFCFFVSQQLELNMFFIFGLDCFKRGSAKQEQYLILSCNKIAHKMSWFQSDTGAWYVRSEVGQNVTIALLS